jgi:hypothetical protein
MAVQGNRFLVEPYDTFGSKVQNLDCGHSLDEPAQVCSHHLTSALGWDGCRFLGFLPYESSDAAILITPNVACDPTGSLP